jgi:cytochrome c biogenesis protein
MKNKNPIWSFFASVKLALFTLFILSTTSIIGTIIPQKEASHWYIERYGEKMANIFASLSFTPDMYSSAWFTSLLALLCINLIVCSLDRLPGVWRQIKADNLATPLARLESMTPQYRWQLSGQGNEIGRLLAASLGSIGWQAELRDREDGTLLFAQKGAMTRLGVYIVHISILVILAGATIGAMLGYKASIMLPETTSTEVAYTQGTHTPVNLGFEVRCDHFNIEYYDNGMPKSYRSQLSILEEGKVVTKKAIVVNDPLTYKGITFYQSSYEPFSDFMVTVTNNNSGLSETEIIPYQQQQTLPKSGLQIWVISADGRGQSASKMKIWFTDNDGEPSLFWLDNGSQTTVQRSKNNYTVSVKQMYATGLQVAKDPGIWLVYIGCGLMLFGLVIAFFTSHQRIWLFIQKESEGKCSLLMTGTANKNKAGFAKTFQHLTERIPKA